MKESCEKCGAELGFYENRPTQLIGGRVVRMCQRCHNAWTDKVLHLVDYKILNQVISQKQAAIHAGEATNAEDLEGDEVELHRYFWKLSGEWLATKAKRKADTV